MNGHQIDELLKRKVDNARRGKALRTVAIALVLLALIVLIAAAVHRHNAKAVSAPDVPSTVETDTEPSPDETDAEKPQTVEGEKPLQPEEMRRKQNKHELVLQWVSVSEEDRPSSVTITVLHQGEEVARFTLSEESEWRHSWSDDYPAETLTLRADLPKSVMASFALRGGQFSVICSGGGTAPVSVPEETEDSDSETSEDEKAEDEPPEAEASEDEKPEEEPEAQSGKIDEPAGEEPAETEETKNSDEIADAPRASHSWWPIVLLMLCGAVLVTLGMLGTDRRRSR